MSLPDRLFHVALVSEWEAALRVGSYERSTRGLSLADVGYLHASREDQWRGVLERFYADVEEPLVLLEIDPARVDVPIVEEPADPSATSGPGTELFPHLYGPLRTDAVVAVHPLLIREGETGR
ncbi:DUF952 domain-containing protein [Nocardioides sp. TRM66260-LWL]|uniref:DUF952 domain-containing protein n=1 Tax=Nocardioides sp. TRM66260-LWL TaxID=2874478 RepID=UPI001CC5CB66|nr:DUF952 domain-containing protein [Nocardioides sp. TRM66260-LWL]MBZ5734243.1 DUF952 domain-containing protein [Nocardioides sp. TRM66260-LWL]